MSNNGRCHHSLEHSAPSEYRWIPKSHRLNSTQNCDGMNLLWFVYFCLLIAPLPLWLYPVHCSIGFWAICGVTVWSCLVLAVCMINATYTMVRISLKSSTTASKRQSNVQLDSLTHVVLMAGYKEPLDVMFKTVDTLKHQTVAKQIFCVIAFEERTPDFEAKSDQMLERYSTAFRHIMVTKHPSGVVGEIPGKCSNANFSVRKTVEEMKQMGLYSPQSCTFTTCDTDNLFPPDYLEWLGVDFDRRTDRDEVIWQPPLFYNYDLDKRPFFVRVTGIIRSVFVMGMLIPQSINAMSIYSMSLALVEKSNYFHPGYQFVDAMDNLYRMVYTGKTVPLILLPCPVINGPTSGISIKQELVEWARQTWRWSIGTAEIFHYFCIKWRSSNFWSFFRYGVVFTHYWGFVLCGMATFVLSAIVSTNVFNAVGVCKPSNCLPYYNLSYIPLGGLGFAYVMFAGCFVIDIFARKLLNVKEEVGMIRNFFHWLSTPFVLLANNCIGLYAIAELAVRGKTVCTHNSSKKTGLVENGQLSGVSNLALEVEA